MKVRKVAEALTQPSVPIIELVDAIVEEAHARNASEDIHICASTAYWPRRTGCPKLPTTV